MSKIFKNLIPYWRWIILIFVFLIAQAYCDLALPAYSSDIIDAQGQEHDPADSVEVLDQVVKAHLLERGGVVASGGGRCGGSSFLQHTLTLGCRG